MNDPQSILLIGFVLIVIPIFMPVVIYYAVRAGRYGWLRAEELFFRNDKNPNEEK